MGRGQAGAPAWDQELRAAQMSMGAQGQGDGTPAGCPSPRGACGVCTGPWPSRSPRRLRAPTRPTGGPRPFAVTLPSARHRAGEQDEVWPPGGARAPAPPRCSLWAAGLPWCWDGHRPARALPKAPGASVHAPTRSWGHTGGGSPGTAGDTRVKDAGGQCKALPDASSHAWATPGVRSTCVSAPLSAPGMVRGMRPCPGWPCMLPSTLRKLWSACSQVPSFPSQSPKCIFLWPGCAPGAWGWPRGGRAGKVAAWTRWRVRARWGCPLGYKMPLGGRVPSPQPEPLPGGGCEGPRFLGSGPHRTLAAQPAAAVTVTDGCLTGPYTLPAPLQEPWGS